MFTIVFAPDAEATLAVLTDDAERARNNRNKADKTKSSRQEGLLKQVIKAINLLSTNPKHPGLHTHVYHDFPNPIRPGEKVFTAYAQNKTPGAYRVFWCYGPKNDDITIIAITPHP